MPKQINVKLGFEADTSQAKKQIQDLQKSLDNLMTSSTKNTALGDFSKDMVEAQQSAVKLKSILGESMNIDTGRLDLVKFNQQLQDSGLTLSKLGSQLSSLGPEGKQAFLSLADSIVTAQKPMVETNKLLDGMWTALKNTARWQLSSSILHGFMSSLQGAYGYAQDLNASLNSIRIVSGQSVEQMAAFADQANRSAQALSTSTLAYTDAALIFYQQGLSGDAVTERVDTVLKLSNVTGDSAEQVSSYMTAIWNNFYDGSQSLESFADKITALGAATASSSAEIAAGLQQFAAIGNTVGLSYDYAATALATIVAQTRQSESSVGNGLRTIFARLSSLKQGGTDEDGTDLTKYTKALAEYGVEVKDQNGSLKEMDQILEEIGAKWQTLSDTQKVALAQTVGGVRQYATIMALFDNWDQFQKNLDVTQNAEGTLQEQADIYAESWEGARKRVQAAWQAIYQDLLDDKFFIWVTNGIASILKGVDSLIDAIGGLKGVLGAAGLAVTTLFNKQLETGIKNAVTNLNKVFYGDKIQASLAQQAAAAAKAQLTNNKEDTANNTIIENQILQIELNEKIRQRKLEINDLDKEYYQSLLKTSEELAKQNALLADRQLASNKDLANVEEGMLYKLYNSPNIDESKSDIEDKWVKILNNQDNTFDTYVKSTLNEKGELDSVGLKAAIGYLKQYNQEVQYSDEELKKLIQTRRENLLITQQSGEAAQKQAVFDAAITAVISQGTKAEEGYSQAIQNQINLLAEENGISAERLQAIEQDASKTDAQTENYSEQEKQILNLIKAKQALNKEDEKGELHQFLDQRIKNQEPENQPKIGFNINTDKIVKGAQAISQITIGVSSLTTAFKVLGDTSIPIGDRILKSLSSIAMALPSLITGISNLAAVLEVSFWQVTAVLAVIAALVYAFKEVEKNTPEGKLAALNEKLDEQKQKVAELRSEYDQLKSSLEGYKDKLEEINKLDGPQKAAAIAEYNAEILELINSLDDYQSVIGSIKFTKDGIIDLSEEDITNILNAKSIEYVNEQLETAQTNIEALKGQLDVDNTKYDGLKVYTGSSTPLNQYVENAYASENKLPGQDVTKLVREIFAENGLTSTSSESKQREALTEDERINNEDIDNIIAAIKEISQNEDDRKEFDAFSNAGKTQNQIDAQTESSQRLALSPSEEFGNLTDESQQQVLSALNNIDVDGLKELYSILTENPNIALIDALKQVGVEVDNLNFKLEDVYKHGDDIKTVINADDLSNFSGKTEELVQEVAQFSEFLQNNVDDYEYLSSHLKECSEAAEAVAYSMIRFDDAMQDVAENYEDWKAMLNSDDVREVNDAVQELKKTYGNLFDIDGSEFSDGFLKDADNLEKLNTVLTGTEEEAINAYNELQRLAALDLAKNMTAEMGITLNTDDFYAAYDEVMSLVDQMHLVAGDTIEVGDADYSNLAASLNSMLALVGNNVEAAQKLLAAMGFQAELENIPAETTDNTDIQGYTTEMEEVEREVTGVEISNGDGDDIIPKATSPVKVKHVSAHVKPDPTTHTEGKKTTNVQGLRIKAGSDLHYVGGGAPKIKNSPVRRTGNTGSSGNKGGGKGGGGGGGSEKKKTVKEHKKPEQKTDRYHDIKERIEDLNTELKRLEKTESRVYGKAKLKYMDQEIDKLEKQIELTDEYIAEIKKYAAVDQANLRGINMGAEFDENGRLTNYEEVLANIVSSYNSSISAYNSAADAFNASAQEDEDSAALEIAEKQVSAAKEVYDERLKILDQYEDTYNLYQEKMDERIDQVWELFDKRLEKITWRIEFELDWNEKELTQFDWLLKYVGKDADHAADAIANLSKQMGVYEESLEWAKQGIASIFDLHGITFDFDNADPQQLYDQLASFMNAQNLESQLTEKEADALLSYMDAMRDAYDGMYDSWIEAHDRMMNAWDEWQERLQEGLNDIAQYGKELEGIQQIVDLTGRKMLKMTTQDINRMNQALVVNAQEYLRAATARRDALEPSVQAAEAHLQELIANGASEEAIQLARDEYRQMMEDWQDATNDWYDAFADAIQAGQKAFEAFIENSTQDYKEGFGKMDLDYMVEQFDRQKKVRDLYLDDYQKYHELNKTAQELNKSLQATNNDLIRGKLLDLQDEMNASMQSGVQISAAQAEIYARRVALLQAEAELLDAQNAKSAVRMTRDNEGNFSYTYTADQEQIDSAQQNYGDRFYELLDFERNYADQIQEEMLQSFEDFIDRRNEIAEMYKDDQDAYNQAMEDLQEEYLAYMDYYVGELDMDMSEMQRLRDDDWLDFESVTGSKLAEHDNFITHFTETITGELTQDYTTAEGLAEHWKNLMEEACSAANTAVSTYQINTADTYNKAGENIETYGNKVNGKFDEMAGKSATTADAVVEMSDDMVTAMGLIQGETYALDEAWVYVMDDMRNQIASTISALQSLMQSLDLVVQKAQAAIAAAQAAAMAEQMAGLGAGVGSGSGGGGGSGSGGNTGGNSGNSNGGNTTYKVGFVSEDGSMGQQTYTFKDRQSANNFLREVDKTNDMAWKIGWATGGYTGAWGPEGKIAMLHEKELVLNKEDTSNILSVVDTVRNMIDNFGGNIFNDIAKSIMGSGSLAMAGVGSMDQNVHIEANFPNVQSHSEIELALNNLINSASQYVNKK